MRVKENDPSSKRRKIFRTWTYENVCASPREFRGEGGRVRLHHGAFGSGEIDFAECDEIYKQHFGFVVQSYHLLDSITVYENLEIPLSYRNVRKSERDAIVCDVLDRFQIVGKKDLFPNQLSGGQQQLVAVARAIIANPKVILADEPTGNLHSSQAKEIMELFKRLNQSGITIVQVTHSETNAAYSHRVIQIADGWIVGS